MNLGLHHLNLRKRAAAGALEPYPAESRYRRFLDGLMMAVGIVQPIALVPQVLSIYVQHATSGVSIITWGLLTVFNFLWMLYGLAHKEMPIIVGNILLTVLDLAIVFGVLLY